MIGILCSRQLPLHVHFTGHCVKGQTLENAVTLKYVRLGEYDIETDSDCIQEFNGQLDCADPPVDYAIEQIIPHPQYNPTNPSKHHDLALLKLNESVKYSDFIQPICLPTSEFHKGLVPGLPHMVCGWGKTDLCKSSNNPSSVNANQRTVLVKQKYGGRIVQSPIKLKVTLPYVDKKNCTKKYAEGNVKLSPSQICAGGVKAKDSCSGNAQGKTVSNTMTNNVALLR